jgi:hypothetical protein
MAKAKGIHADTTHSGISTPMFANDVRGDCVLAGHAHQALRFGAELEFLNSEQVRQAIYADEPGSWGGDYIYVPGYTAQGPVCVSWSPQQQMTWAWLDKYGDEPTDPGPDIDLA